MVYFNGTLILLHRKHSNCGIQLCSYYDFFCPRPYLFSKNFIRGSRCDKSFYFSIFLSSSAVCKELANNRFAVTSLSSDHYQTSNRYYGLTIIQLKRIQVLGAASKYSQIWRLANNTELVCERYFSERAVTPIIFVLFIIVSLTFVAGLQTLNNFDSTIAGYPFQPFSGHLPTTYKSSF